MLQLLDLSFSYTSESDDLFNDFYAPVLSVAKEYKRAVGYFSIGVLFNTPQALSSIVTQNGSIKIIFAKIVSEEDFLAIKNGLELMFSDEEMQHLDEAITYDKSPLLSYRVKLLGYLFQKGVLEIKVAIRRRGMFHQKIGIVSDDQGNKISFSGSMNETNSALNHELNSEEISVFKSWNAGQTEFVQKHDSDFDRLWSNTSSEHTVVCDLPTVIRDKLDLISQDTSFRPSVETERSLIEKYFGSKPEVNVKGPRVPTNISGRAFQIREHQTKALQAWAANGFRGILELATGTGKTITSIYAATKIAEQNSGVALVVAVPYVNLGDQWIEELKLFNIHALRCYGSKDKWLKKLKEYFKRNRSEQREFIALVVVNKTLKTEDFQSCLHQFEMRKTVFIGDECHHHGAEIYHDRLPADAKFKLGLSATPFHYLDEENNQRLRSFYGDVVYEYSLFNAIKNNILTPYEYYPIPVELTPDEATQYNLVTTKIGQIISSSADAQTETGEFLQSLLMQRARLVGTARNKLVELERLIAETGVNKHTLFYCSDGSISDEEDEFSYFAPDDEIAEVKQRYLVQQILRKHGVRASPFTSNESRYSRSEILRQFKQGDIDALIAIKCLDEGIDVPACNTAFLIASSRNPRQFVQRRGRILRRSPGKEKAIIYDFVPILPNSEDQQKERDISFFKEELKRVADFAKHSIDPILALKPLNKLLIEYDLLQEVL